jgi:hypothetical protein
MYLQPLGGYDIVVEWEINQKIALTPSVILPLDQSESSIPNSHNGLPWCRSILFPPRHLLDSRPWFQKMLHHFKNYAT